MGKLSSTYPVRCCRRFAAALVVFTMMGSISAQTPAQALNVPLILPAGLAYDSGGNLIFAESGRHLIRRVSPTGILSTVAGTGTQGLAGDGGPASAALLDTPTAVALDAAGDIFFADSHNHRVRRIDAATAVISTVVLTASPSALAVDSGGNLVFADAQTHLIRRMDHASGGVTTVAGNGTQGLSGDGGSALHAALDSPAGLAVDAQGDLFISDTHNSRIRRVDASTGIITSLAVASSPRGLTVDASGHLLLADRQRNLVLRIDASNGTVQALAGSAIEGFFGDGGQATLAALDQPGEVTLSPSGLATLTDSLNGRVRQVDAAGVIHTIAGLGGSAAATLTLSAPSVLLYGTGALKASLVSSAATGSVAFFDATDPASLLTLASVPLQGNTAIADTSMLPAGLHRFFATYAGDTLHTGAESATVAVAISPAAAIATPDQVSIVYGAPIPNLTGTLTGVLVRDLPQVKASFASAATSSSDPASYPINASLSGAEASNYSLTTIASTVVIAKAPVVVSLSNGLLIHVASTTSGAPSGTVTLFDGNVPYNSASLPASGDVTFSGANLSVGSHTLIANYTGDRDFLGAASAPLIVNIGPVAAADFTLTATGQMTVTVPPGTAAQYGFAVAPVNGGLASPLLLTASGLPAGAVATFNPAYLPPAGTPSAFVLTIQTPKAALAPPFISPHNSPNDPAVFALLLPALWCVTRRGRRRYGMLCVLLVLDLFPLGCGDRINNSAASSAAARSYAIVVTATGTQTSGAALQHTATVTLVVQP